MSSHISSRLLWAFVVMFVASGFAKSANGQVLQTVPKVGQWVEFDGEKRNFDGTSQAWRVRFACVEADKVDDKPAVWMEVEWSARDGSDPNNFISRMKLLVPAKLGKEDDPRAIKCKTYVQYPNEPALRLAKPVSEEYAAVLRSCRCGCVAPKAVMGEAKEEEILTGEQSTKTRTTHYRYVQAGEDGMKVEHRFWLADEVPFGVARFAHKVKHGDGTGFECDMTFRRKGEDAKPQWQLPAQ